MTLRTAIATLFTASLWWPATALATDVQPGADPVVHLPPSFWDFGPAPLAAGYFGPGSDPFDGGVPADASVIPSSPYCPGPLGETSMLVQRKTPAVLPGVPSSDTVEVEIVELSLVSADPITVTYFGGLDPELWNVEIALSPSYPSTGTLTVRQEHPEGGTFDADIALHPYFTFRRVADGEVRTLDGGGIYQDFLTVVDVPWVYSDPGLACPACASNFLPGHTGAGLIPFPLTGASSQHTVRCSCSRFTLPALSPWSLAGAATLLLTLGIYSGARRRRAAMARIS